MRGLRPFGGGVGAIGLTVGTDFSGVGITGLDGGAKGFTFSVGPNLISVGGAFFSRAGAGDADIGAGLGVVRPVFSRFKPEGVLPLFTLLRSDGIVLRINF